MFWEDFIHKCNFISRIGNLLSKKNVNLVLNTLKLFTVVLEHIYGNELELESLLNHDNDRDEWGQLARGIRMIVYGENFKRDESVLGIGLTDDLFKLYEFMIKSFDNQEIIVET